MIPGEVFIKKGEIVCNAGKKTVKLPVINTGDRPIQVGSHIHFFEVNKQMSFDRQKAFGMRLNVPAATAVRFEPGEKKEVVLVEFGGKKNIVGINALTQGHVGDSDVREKAFKKAKTEGFVGM